MKTDNCILSDHQRTFSYWRPHLQKVEDGDVFLFERITLPIGMTNKPVIHVFLFFGIELRQFVDFFK